jgi:hypothetical protein
VFDGLTVARTVPLTRRDGVDGRSHNPRGRPMPERPAGSFTKTPEILPGEDFILVCYGG